MLNELAGLTPEKSFCVDTIVSELPGQACREYSHRDAGFADCNERARGRKMRDQDCPRCSRPGSSRARDACRPRLGAVGCAAGAHLQSPLRANRHSHASRARPVQYPRPAHCQREDQWAGTRGRVSLEQGRRGRPVHAAMVTSRRERPWHRRDAGAARTLVAHEEASLRSPGKSLRNRPFARLLAAPRSAAALGTQGGKARATAVPARASDHSPAR